ncbi:MAG: hypothetical protein IGS49_27565 [Chlorogloeopsis fritschii C42_A2020_084]|nr:hypothetical protein [Chlorogloeopsis fritschii]MBF2009100.1 hypothetical protein [Chlorogloeopsis fritschii C42_A2020_084]
MPRNTLLTANIRSDAKVQPAIAVVEAVLWLEYTLRSLVFKKLILWLASL